MWNPFSNKPDPNSSSGTSIEDTLDELNKQLQYPYPGAPLIPATPGTVQVPYVPNSLLTPQHLQQMLEQMSISGLTSEEKVEFDKLTEEYKQEIKTAKITAFKKLPTELRQFVINFFTWQEAVDTISNVSPSKSDRLKELDAKNEYGRLFGQGLGQYIGGWTSHTHTASGIISVGLRLPEDLTAEELKQAHIEASMEEEMLNGEK